MKHKKIFIYASLTAIILFIIAFFTLLNMRLDLFDKKNISNDENSKYQLDNESVKNDVYSTESNLKTLKQTDSSINLLLLGGDDVNENTDIIMVLNINFDEKKIHLLSIPRDTKARIKNIYTKINSAYPTGGAKLALESVSNLINLQISKYIYINTSTFSKIVDLLGGVDIYIDSDMDYDDPEQKLHIHFKKGYQHLDGKTSEQYVRYRKSDMGKINEYYNGSDLKRIDAQHKFIVELILQKINILNIGQIKNIVLLAFDNIKTNFTLSEILKIIEISKQIDSDNIKTFTLPGNVYDSEEWYYICDEIESAKIINEYFSR